MRPIKPRGPANPTSMPRQPMPMTNVLPSKPAPAIGGGGPAAPMPGPAVNIQPTRGGAPMIGGGGPANPTSMPRPTSMPMTNVKPAAPGMGMKKGGKVKSSASKRADGIAQRGKTKGKFV